MSKKNLKIIQIPISTGTIAAGGTYTSGAIALHELYTEGYFSLHLTFTGDGTAKVEYLCSNSVDGTFVEPESATDILTGMTKTSGPGSDGIVFEKFDPEVSLYMKIKFTETGTSNSIAATGNLAIQ